MRSYSIQALPSFMQSLHTNLRYHVYQKAVCRFIQVCKLVLSVCFEYRPQFSYHPQLMLRCSLKSAWGH